MKTRSNCIAMFMACLLGIQFANGEDPKPGISQTTASVPETHYQFSTIRLPGSAGLFATEAQGINNNGQIVGDSQAGVKCFVYADGNYATFTVPFNNALGTASRGINDSGSIVGYFTVSSSAGSYGFLKKNTSFTKIEVPGSTWTSANGINNRGEVVGHFKDAKGTHGFLLNNGNFRTIEIPVQLYYLGETAALGVNESGHIVGYTGGGYNYTGFLNVKDAFTKIAFPNAKETFAQGINNHDQVVGYYKAQGLCHGFLFDHGIITKIDYPNAKQTWVSGINENGKIVGTFDNGQERQGFVASPLAKN